MDTTIDEVKIEIESSSDKASSNLDKLAESISRLQGILNPALSQIKEFSSSLLELKTTSANIDFSNTGIENIQTMLSGISSFKKPTNFASILTQLKEIPSITQSLGTKEISEFTIRINQLTQVLTPLATQLDKVSTSFSNLPSNITKVSSAVKTINAQTKTSKGGIFGGLLTGVSGATIKTTAFIAIMKRLATSIGNAITISNEYVENLNLFRVSMGETTEVATKFVDTFSEALGVDPSNVMRYMGIFNNLIEGFGLSSDAAYTMSKNLTQLSYDMSSFLNIDIETAMKKLKSGISGEIEPMRAIGVALDQATLQETAYALGIDKKVASMTRAQKTELLYYQTMTKTTKMQGDMARTLIQPANALRVMKQQFTLLARAIGNIFIPIIMKVLPYINALTQALTVLVNRIANFLGFQIAEIDYSGLDGFTSGIEDVGDSAVSTSKKIDRMLNKFDELNVIDFGDTTGADDDETIGGSLGIPLYDYDALKGLVETDTEKIKKKLKEFLSEFKGVFETISKWIEKFEPLLKGLGTLFLSVFAGSIIQKIGTFIRKLGLFKNIVFILGRLKGAFSVAGIAMSGVTGIVAKLSVGASSLWISFKDILGSLSPLTKLFLGLGSAIGTFTTSYDAIKKLTLGTTDLGTALLNIGIAATAFGTILSGLVGGPLGITITAIAALTGGVLAYEEAQKELREQEVLTELFDGQGQSMEAVTEYYEAMYDGFSAYAGIIEENKSKIDSLNDSYTKTENSLEVLLEQMNSSYYIKSQEDVEQVSTSFNELANTVDDTTDTMAESIMTNIKNLKEQGLISEQEAQRAIDAIMREKVAREGASAVIKQQMEQAKADYLQGKIGLEEYTATTEDLVGQLNELSTATTASDMKFKDLSEQIKTAKINFGDTKDIAKVEEWLNNLTSLYDEQVSSIEDTMYASEAMYQSLIDSAKKRGEDTAELEATMATVTAGNKKQLETIQGDYLGLFLTIQNQIITSGASTAEDMQGVVTDLNNIIAKIGDVDVTGKGAETLEAYTQEVIESGNINAPKMIQSLKENAQNIKQSGWLDGIELTGSEKIMMQNNFLEGTKLDSAKLQEFIESLKNDGLYIKNQWGEAIEFTAAEKEAISKLITEPYTIDENTMRNLLGHIIDQGGIIRDEYGKAIEFSQSEIDWIHGKIQDPITSWKASQSVWDKFEQFGNGIPETIAQGITDKAQEAYDATGDLVDGAVSSASEGYNYAVPNLREETRNFITGTITDSINAEVPNINSATYAVGEGAVDSLSDGIDNNLQGALDTFGGAGTELGNKLSDNLKVNGTTLKNTLLSSLTNIFTKLKTTNSTLFGFLKLPTIKWFADGGFPETGQLFAARENGPELVGNIGNKAAVANNDQIIAGIAEASYQGVSQALKENKSNQRQPVNVYIGNDKIYSGYGSYANSQNNMYGTNIIKV